MMISSNFESPKSGNFLVTLKIIFCYKANISMYKTDVAEYITLTCLLKMYN